MPERYRERSPIHFVGNIKGRLLIVQGMRDPNVTPENVRAVRAALDAAHEYDPLAFDDEGHGIGKPANQAAVRRLAEFFGEAFAPARGERALTQIKAPAAGCGNNSHMLDVYWIA